MLTFKRSTKKARISPGLVYIRSLVNLKIPKSKAVIFLCVIPWGNVCVYKPSHTRCVCLGGGIEDSKDLNSEYCEHVLIVSESVVK